MGEFSARAASAGLSTWFVGAGGLDLLQPNSPRSTASNTWRHVRAMVQPPSGYLARSIARMPSSCRLPRKVIDVPLGLGGYRESVLDIAPSCVPVTSDAKG